MANIGAVTLVIETSPTSSYAVARARFNINFTSNEVRSNLAHRLLCQLVGDDDGLLNRQDEPIRDGVMTDQILRPNGQARRPFNLVLNILLPRRDAEEIGTDEIRALVTLKPQVEGATPIARLSNRIELNVAELMNSRG